MTLLIVNADDYGLTPAVSQGILDAHRRGVVTSTSALALAPGFARCARWLDDHPELGVGVHLAAVGEDPPLLTAAEIPTLVDRRGRLAASWRQFLPRAAAGRIDPADLRREFAAQLAAVRAARPAPTHLDTHQHLHLWPLVGRVVLELASAEGVPAVRVTRSAARSPVGAGVRRLARRLEHAAAGAARQSPARFAGLDEAGRLDEAALVAALEALAGAESAEIGCHPGAGDDPDRARYRWGYSWEAELAALCSPGVRRRVDQLGFRLGTFAALGAAA
ncbi:MAG: ChbG/HpnK family deacetylase [Acidimicrobiales bacterium]